MASLMDLIAGYSLPNGLLNMNYKTRNRAGQPVQPSTDTITNAITQGLLPMLASAGIGTGAGIAGQFGEAENLGKLAINKLGGNVNPNTTLPTQEGILSYLNSITPLKPYTDNTYTKIGANLLAPILDPTALITTARASKPVAKAVGEHAWNKTEDMMRQQGLMPNIVAYHGTPHEIKGGFDISKVGTGEGAQSYGHGMYFAENPIVAEGYKEALSTFKTTLDGVPITSDNPKFSAVMTIGSQGYKKALEQAELAKKSGFVKPEIANQEIANIKALKNSKIESVKQGNLYKVDIPDKDIPNMLDWDKPLLQQTPQVQEALAKLGIKSDKQKLSQFDDALLNALMNDGKTALPKQPINPTGQDIYQKFIQGNPQLTSQKLNEAGIRGIRYLDEGSRNLTNGEIINTFKTPEGWKTKVRVTGTNGTDANGKPISSFTTSMPFKTAKEAEDWAKTKISSGTSNFVVFDPKEVKILEKNSKKLGE